MKIIPLNIALYGDYFDIVLWRNWLEINEEIGKRFKIYRIFVKYYFFSYT